MGQDPDEIRTLSDLQGDGETKELDEPGWRPGELRKDPFWKADQGETLFTEAELEELIELLEWIVKESGATTVH